MFIYLVYTKCNDLNDKLCKYEQSVEQDGINLISSYLSIHHPQPPPQTKSKNQNK